jgi:mono/diheme cytochrome c family protein
MRLVLGIVIGLVGTAARADDAKNDEFFEKHVRPVLANRCLACHGEKAKGGLRLDSRAAVLLGGDGGAVVESGKPNSSRLILAVRHAGGLKMPENNMLPDAEIAALEKWVELGLPWPKGATLAKPDALKTHWAFQPLKKHELRSTKSESPIDHFIKQKFADNGLSPSPRADRRTLVRRLSFDLLGLPPTPAEVAAFVADPSADAYERLIDALLARPEYGERWGRHWLDVARYADNKGYVFFEQQEYPWAWTYRDYVIDAFNRDLPFDRFVLEQLAADQLKLDDPKRLAALGFLTVGGHFMNNTHDVIDDRIDVVTRGLMGVTVSCARCHDHKFDPIPAADYYSLYGVFRGSTEPGVPPLWGKEPTDETYKTFAAELTKREKALVDFVTAKHKELVAGARTRAGEYLLAVWTARNQPPADDFMLIADKGDINPAMITRWRTYLDEVRKKPDGVWTPWFAFAAAEEKDFEPVTKKLADKKLNPRVRAAFAVPPRAMKDVADRYGKLFAEVEKAGKTDDPAAEELRGVLYGPRSPADAPMALDWGFLSLFPDRATQDEYQKLLKALETHVATGPPRAMVLLDSPRPFEPRVFERGNPNRLGEYVPRQFLRLANANRKPFTTGSGRLELAREIVSPANPLTARVFVNRVWAHHFGRGIVATPGDFGTRGDPPTHPELLDWLAADFMANGWRVKRLHKLMLMTETYQQTSLPENRKAVALDPENRWLGRMSRRRLDYEALHDAMLAVSDNLLLKSKAVPLFGGTGKKRAVYAHVNRLEFPSLWSTFDVPAPTASVSQRVTTTTAPQALFLLNGPFIRDAAKRFAGMKQLQKLDPAARIDAMFRHAYGRGPDAEERELAAAFVAKGDRWADFAQSLLMANEFAFVD